MRITIDTKVAAQNSASELRALERWRITRITTLSNVLAKIITACASFATVPLTLNYLGAERFGLWMTISSISSIAAFADLGLGNGLLNAISTALGKDDKKQIQELISSALVVLASIAILIATSTALYLWIIPVNWTQLFGLQNKDTLVEINLTIYACVICFCINLVSSAIQRIQLALQLGFLNALTNILGAMLTLGSVLLAIYFRLQLHWLVLALLCGPIIASFITGIWLFGVRETALRPTLRCASWWRAKQLLSIGSLFLLLQVTSAIAYALDNAIGAHFTGATSIAALSIATKLFSIPAVITGIVLNSLWPMYAEAISRGDIDWVTQTVKQSILKVCTGTLLTCIVVACNFSLIAKVWLGNDMPFDRSLVAGVAAWTVVGSVGNTIAIFLNAAQVIAPQVCIAILFSVTCLVAKVYVVQDHGISSIPWTTAIGYALLVLPLYAILLPRLLGKLRKNQAN